MDKGKLIPILIAVVLGIVAVCILVRNISNNNSFEKLSFSYNANDYTYDDVKVDNVYVINNVSFWVISVEKNQVVLNSSDYLNVDGNETNEYKLQLNKETKVCFKDDSCIRFKLL